MTRAPLFHRNLLKFLSPKVEASCRFTISLNWGWRHFPGVPDVELGVTAAAAVGALGVEGRDWTAIYVVIGRKQGEK